MKRALRFAPTVVCLLALIAHAVLLPVLADRDPSGAFLSGGGHTPVLDGVLLLAFIATRLFVYLGLPFLVAAALARAVIPARSGSADG